MTGLHPQESAQEYTIPEGCPVCGADLSVKVTAAGPRGVCGSCHWLGRPLITMTHRGMRVSVDTAQA